MVAETVASQFHISLQLQARYVVMRLCFMAAVWMVVFMGPTASAVRAQDNIVIVLDASGSMGEKMSGSKNTKMDEAKRALSQVMQSVPKETRVGMLIFSSKNLRNDLAYPLGPIDLAKLDAAIQSPRPAGGTPLGAYLKKAADILLEQREKQLGYGTFRLLVVTDGEESPPQLVDTYLPDILSRGITVDVIGVDMKSDHSLATKVHSYRRANDPAALVQGLKEVIAEIGGTKNDLADAAALGEIEAVPEELGKAMLASLVKSTSGNYPIGDRPPVPPSDSTPPGDSTISSPAVPASLPVPPAQTPRDNGGWGTVCIFTFAVIVIVLTWFIRNSQRRRST